MINNNLLNTTLVNGQGAIGAEPIVGDFIKFNDFLFNKENFIITELERDGGSETDFEAYDVPRANGEALNGFYRRRKIIPIKGYITADTVTELNTILKNLRIALFNEPEKYLHIKENGVETRYKATIENQNSAITRGKLITMRYFDFEFIVLEGSGEELGYTASAIDNQTALNLTFEVVNPGEAYTKPVFIFKFNTADAIEAVAIHNQTTGEKINFPLETNLSDGDILRFDVEQTLFEKIGQTAELGYQGPPPFLQTGKNSINIELTGNSANYNLTTKFKQRF